MVEIVNLDIKNVLEQLLYVCDQADLNKKTPDIKTLVIREILSFIAYITISDSTERVNFFKSVYFTEDVGTVPIIKDGHIPEFFYLLSERSRHSIEESYINAIISVGK